MNIFNYGKPVVTPETVVTPAVTVTPVETTTAPKKSFLSTISSPFAGCTFQGFQKYETSLKNMMKKMPHTNEALAHGVYESIKGDDTATLLKYHRDLNLLSFEGTKKSETFAKFKALMPSTEIQRLISKGCSMFASLHGGVSEAEKALDSSLVEGMKKGLDRALQAVDKSSEVIQAYVNTAVNKTEEPLKAALAKDVEASKAVKGATVQVSPESVEAAKQALQEISEIENNSILSEEAKKGPAAKKIAEVKTQAEETIANADKQQTVDSINGTYQEGETKLQALNDLTAQLKALSTLDDSSVANGRKVGKQRNDLVKQIIVLMKEIDPETTVSEEIILNPLSKNISREKATELSNKFAYAANRVQLITNTKIAEANKEFVEKLTALQNKKPMYKRCFSSSPESKAISQHTGTLAKISKLTEKVKAFEAVEAYNTFEAQQRKENKGETLYSMLPTLPTWFKKQETVSPLELAQKAYESATEALGAFEMDETTSVIMSKKDELNSSLTKLDKTRFIFGSKAKAKEKVQAELEALESTHVELFIKHDELKAARKEALANLEVAIQVEDEAMANKLAEEESGDFFIDNHIV